MEKEGKFRTCAETGFCLRNKRLQSQEGLSPFSLVPGSLLAVPSDDRFVSEVVNNLNDHRFRLEVSSFGDDVFRVHLNEKEPLRPRFQATEALLPNLSPKAPSRSSSSSGDRLFGSVEINESPLSFKFFDPQTGELLVEANGRGLLNFEELRRKDDPEKKPQNGVDPSIYKSFSTENFWEERVKDSRDSKPFGSSSLLLS
jgi:hypothetical protein